MRKEVKQVAERILEADRIHVLAHLDADGISAAAIIAKALLAIGKPFELLISSHLKRNQSIFTSQALRPPSFHGKPIRLG